MASCRSRSSSRSSSSCWSACSCAITGRAAAINVERVKIGVYVAGGVLAAVGGLMEAGRVSAVTGQQGYQEGIIFNVFAAAVIGGVSLQGGRGNMVGAASGVILLG